MKVFYRRKRPHYQPGPGKYFITFRVQGSIPVAGLKNQLIVDKGPCINFRDVLARDRLIHDHIKRHSIFNNPTAAAIVQNTILYHDRKKYDLLSSCIMPNHVHILIEPREKNGDLFSLGEITHSIKSYSALRVNQALKRSASLWEIESYDHYCRSEESVIRILRYILDNPVKAKLVESWQEWEWTYCREDLIHLVG